MRRHLTLSVLLFALILGACGTKGSLTLPPPPKAPPAPASTTVQPASAPDDLNTAKEAVQ
ncbi:LPS translocon maturation chaperone LptM [Propionivibrio sp.]|uniref:LPS translocon maturation chaperone LptM n=1 Tax=Propionivibrio sp. TaxID=2212460 RepID=UPI003BEFFA3B